jgi:hypothetical protein
MNVSDNPRATKRVLRQRIGQLRRQLDRRLETARRDTRRLMSLEEWLRNRPWAAVLTALGLGAAAAKGMRGAAEPQRESFSPKQLGHLAATFWQWISRWRDSWSAAVDAVRQSMASTPESESAAAEESPGAAFGETAAPIADAPCAEGERHVAD